MLKMVHKKNIFKTKKLKKKMRRRRKRKKSLIRFGNFKTTKNNKDKKTNRKKSVKNRKSFYSKFQSREFVVVDDKKKSNEWHKERERSQLKKIHTNREKQISIC